MTVERTKNEKTAAIAGRASARPWTRRPKKQNKTSVHGISAITLAAVRRR